MEMLMLERAHLEIIEALKRTGSLTKAAADLNLTQSALTHSIKKLESLSGASIWEKEGRSLILTDAGNLLLREARFLLPRMIDIETQLVNYGTGNLGALTIGVECHPCFEWLVHLIQHYLRLWPEVDIDITRNFQFDGLEALENRKVNMLVTPDPLVSEFIELFDILDFELQLMVSTDHKLASMDFVSPEDLNNEVLYTYPVEKSRLDIYKLPIRPRQHIPVESTELMVQLVAAGRGVSAFPDWLIKKYSADSSVTAVAITKESIDKKLYLAVRKEDLELPYIKGFLDLARHI